MRQRFVDTLDFWRYLFERFLADHGPKSAAALTYTTLFAVVPIMTLIFVVLSVIPEFQGIGEQIQGFIFRNFVPSSGAVLQDYLRTFIEQARHLTWLGVGVLMVTALLMLMTVEHTFNTIWRVRQPRRGLSSFLLHWAILSLGPLLLGTGFALSTYITSLSLISDPYALAGARMLLKVMPLMFSTAAFTLLYAAVPNTSVPLRHALLGGLFAAVLFEAAKGLFGLYVALFPTYQLIYGAFAAVPLFLLWMYLSWMIVLLGAELVCNLSASRGWRRNPLPRLLVLLGVLRVFHQRQQSGHAVRQSDVQRAGWALPDSVWDEIVDFLEREQLVYRTSDGGWVLCRDLNRYSLESLLSRSPWPLPHLDQLPEALDEPWFPALRSALERLQRERAALFGDSLAHWLQPPLPEP
ncbi:YihY family inner membrane protein [Azotobacter salinestris]|uniref:YihY family inner membrane protein n=1 Tax=Azotobacter salinestris TaxID=69964 RepID=UPI001266965A|nr:YihY family inner membrane protein [Azotobacter salinestris]